MRKLVILESDCASVITPITSKKLDRSPVMHIVKEIQVCFHVIPEVKCKKVRRECNAIAHELARLANRTVHCAVWRDSVPSCVSELLASECTSVID